MTISQPDLCNLVKLASCPMLQFCLELPVMYIYHYANTVYCQYHH